MVLLLPETLDKPAMAPTKALGEPSSPKKGAGTGQSLPAKAASDPSSGSNG